MKLIIYLKRAVIVFFAILIASQFLNSEPVDLSDSQEAILKGLPADQQASIRQKIQESNRLQGEIENIMYVVPTRKDCSPCCSGRCSIQH